jgi:hypothetical protein
MVSLSHNLSTRCALADSRGSRGSSVTALQPNAKPQVVVEGGRARGSFARAKRESVSTLIKNPPPGAPASPIMPPVDGYLLLDKSKFPASFVDDVSAEKAAFMADTQVQ